MMMPHIGIILPKARQKCFMRADSVRNLKGPNLCGRTQQPDRSGPSFQVSFVVPHTLSPRADGRQKIRRRQSQQPQNAESAILNISQNQYITMPTTASVPLFALDGNHPFSMMIWVKTNYSEDPAPVRVWRWLVFCFRITRNCRLTVARTGVNSVLR